MKQIVCQEKCKEYQEDIDLQKENFQREEMHAKDSIENIILFKQLKNEDSQKLLQSNLENLNQLSYNFESYNKQYIQQFELMITSIKKWNQSIQLIRKKKKEINDHLLFIKFIKEEQDIRIQDYIDFKTKFQNLIQKRKMLQKLYQLNLFYLKVLKNNTMKRQQIKKARKLNKIAQIFYIKVNLMIYRINRECYKQIYSDYSDKVNATISNLRTLLGKLYLRKKSSKLLRIQAQQIKTLFFKDLYQMNIYTKQLNQ